MQWRAIALDRGDIGVRVDRVVLRHVPEASRNRIQKLIESGSVLINGAPAPRAAWRVQRGDELRVRLEPERRRATTAAEAIELEVLFEDAALFVLNKPAGLVVHPSYKNSSGTLMNGVFERAKRWEPGTRPALLGRLDKHTSGVVIVTKLPAVHASLQRAMNAGRVDKDYLAVVWGRPTPPRGTIDLALDRDPWDRRKVTVTDRGGQPSITKYERLASADGLSLVQCRLITGRMHQIRVHLAARGWPVVGDRVYGRKGDTFPRQALHAWRIRFVHPLTRSPIEIAAPVPADIKGLHHIVSSFVLSDAADARRAL